MTTQSMCWWKNHHSRRPLVANREHLLISTEEINVFLRILTQNRISHGIELFRYFYFLSRLRFSDVEQPSLLRLVSTPLHRSTRDDNLHMGCGALIIKTGEYEEPEAAVPLKNVTVEAWIDVFAADVTINQVFVNQENNTVEAIYVFPIEVCLILSHSVEHHPACSFPCRKTPLSTRSRHRSMIAPLSPKSKRKPRLSKSTALRSQKDEQQCFSDKVNRPSTHSLYISFPVPTDLFLNDVFRSMLDR